MKSTYSVSVVVVTYNSARWLPALFESLRRQAAPFEIVVLDNGSDDETAAMLHEHEDIARILTSRQNLGFAEGNNVAARQASGTHLFFLNPDTTLAESTISEVYRAVMMHPDAILALRQEGYDSHDMLTMGNGMDVLGYPTPPKRHDRPFYADGAAMVVPAEVFQRLDGFDEALFMFHEDIDLCWRAQLAGKKIVAWPDAVVHHFSGGSAGGGSYQKPLRTNYFRRYHGEKNILRNLLKNYSFPLVVGAVAAYMAQQACEIVVMAVFRRRDFVAADFDAIKWNVRNIRDTLRKRREVQALRRVNDGSVLKRAHIRLRKWELLRLLGIPEAH